MEAIVTALRHIEGKLAHGSALRHRVADAVFHIENEAGFWAARDGKPIASPDARELLGDRLKELRSVLRADDPDLQALEAWIQSPSSPR
jgi:hypothetical protein